MRYILSIIILGFFVVLKAQYQIDLDGNAKIEGRIDIVAAVGDSSVFIGAESGINDDGTNNGNTALGIFSLNSNTSGYENTSVGPYTLYLNTTGHRNTAVGYEAMYSTTTGAWNVACGRSALKNNVSGNFNTAYGIGAMTSNISGHENTAIGRSTLNTNTTGSQNTALGRGADVSAADLSNATAIGYLAEVNASNKVRIGNDAITVIEGEVAFSASSDRRLKKNIQKLETGLDLINDLNPVMYQRLKSDDPELEMGLIAQELLEVLEKHGLSESGMVSIPNNRDHFMSVRYNDLLAPIIKAIQELTEENKELKQRVIKVEQLEASLLILEEKVSKLSKHND